MPPKSVFATRFQKQLKRKRERDPGVANAVVRTVDLVLTDPQNNGLNLHLLDRGERVWDAYVTRSIRVTFQRVENAVVFRNNCRHDIIDRRQW